MSVEHWRAFDAAFFARNQRRLLRALNGRLTARVARWAMAIRPYDCPAGEPIVAIGPSWISYGERTVSLGGRRVRQMTSSFRTHAKYSKRVYCSLRPLWWAMHAADWALLDRVVPAYSFGYSTLTAYPDTAPGESVSFDGMAQRTGVDQSFSAIRSGAGNASTNSTTFPTSAVQLVSSSTPSQFSRLNRVIELFDTSAIGASGVVTAATLSLYGFARSETLGSTTVEIVSSNPASNTAIANADYGNLGSTSFASIAGGSISTSAYNDFTLDAGGVANVSVSGVSKFGHRLGWDLSGTFGGTWTANKTTDYIFYNADNTGTSKDPKLEVTYHLELSSTIAEPAAVADSLQRLSARAAIEAVAVGAAATFRTGRVAVEAVAVAAAGLFAIAKTYADPVAVTGTLSKSIGRVASESAAISETLSAYVGAVLSEAASVSGSLQTALNGIVTFLWSKVLRQTGTWTPQPGDTGSGDWERSSKL